MSYPLTRRQQEIYEYLQTHAREFPHPPTFDELCAALGLLDIRVLDHIIVGRGREYSFAEAGLL